MDDPFRFDEIDRAWLAAKPGVKWARCASGGELAAWVADMDLPPARPITDALRALADGRDYGYPDWPDGHGSPLRQLFADRMRERYGWEIDPRDCHELNDVVQGIQLTLHLATEPGDGVVLHLPAYPPFLRTLEDMDRRAVPVAARRASAGWAFDLDALDAELRARPARALLLCHPHNPTGRVFDRHELERLADLAARHDLVVIADEIHAELVHDPHVHIPFASVHPDAAARTVTITSASKAFNLAGLRWAVAHVGHPALRARVRALPNHLLGVPNVAAVAATEAAWTAGEGWSRAVRSHLDRNRRLVAERSAELPGVDHVMPEATYLAWLDCRALEWGEEPYDRFLRSGVRLSPGADFGAPGFVRLNFATARPVLDEVLDRMSAAVTAAP